MPAFERGIVLFAGGGDVDVSSMLGGLDAESALGLRTYMDGQPTRDQLSALPEDEAETLAEDRLWALVHYLQSLTRPKSWFDRQFRGNPEFNTGRSGR